MKTPLVTIIMATHNRAPLIKKSLESIIAQTYKNWECLIIDDHGTDNTSDIIKPLLNIDERFKYLKRGGNHKKGLPGCRNHGLEIAKGEFIIFFDDDDIVHPQNLKLCITAFEELDVDFCSYQKQPFFGENKNFLFENQDLEIQREISKDDIGPILKNEIPLASCTVMWKSMCFEAIRFNEELMYAEEWECYSRIIMEEKRGVLLENILYFNRKHSLSNTGEFYKGDRRRVRSKIKAVNLVLESLNSKHLFPEDLKKHFIRMGFSLNDFSIIENTLKNYGAGPLEKIKYWLGYKLYPLIRPIFQLKSKFIWS